MTNLLREIANSPINSFAADGTEPQAQCTLGQVIGRTASRFPHQTAIVSTTFAPLTYGDLQRQLEEIRGQLRLGGFNCSARIGVLMPYGPEAVLAIVAVACCSIAVPLDPRLLATEIDQRLDMLRLNALLIPQGSSSEVRKRAERRGIAILEAAPAGHGQLGLAVAVHVADSPATDAEPDPSSAAFILQTSGTTAQPKLIPFSHSNMLAAAARLQAWFDLTPRDRCLSVSPPFYSHGLKVTVFTPLLTGSSIAVPKNGTILALDEWFDILRPTWYSAGPTLHAAVLDKATSQNALTEHTLRFVVSGGAPLPKEVHDGLQRILGVPVLEHYGSSEAAQITANQPPPGPNRPGTCGQPWPETLAIVGKDGHPLPVGARGEIMVRGPTVTSGYLDAPELNRAAFVGGWFRTGDIGSLDADGFLSVHGRVSELINRGGEKIAPAEVESVLLRHPAVAEAAAFAVFHPRLGEDVAAAIVPRPHAHATPLELRHFLQGELASFKIPRRILILDELPKGPTGKVQRRRLRELIDTPTDHQEAMPGPDVNRGPLDDLEAELLTLWRRLLKSEAVTIDDDFFASGGDSLLAMEMLLEVERRIGRPVPDTILFGAETIREFGPKIAMQMNAPPTPILEFNGRGDRPPLYFFNGDLVGGHSCMRQMVELFGADYPIISINPHGRHGEPIPPSIEKMAADRLPLILERQASGPFLLGGKCNGAMVAFEAARLLMAAGHMVDMVAMVDPPTVGASLALQAILGAMRLIVSRPHLQWTYELMALLERFFNTPTSQQITIARLHRALSNPGNPNYEVPPATWSSYSSAMAQYRPL
ncbi:acyl-CoA synthetase (AMP-forming)/AMP-acid ligase II, partial [Bradyrhizobium huanghuaihaiense]